MSNIILGYRQDFDKRGGPIITYADSTRKALVDLGHTITPLGEGHTHVTFKTMSKSFLDQQSLFLDVDCGRNNKGSLSFHCYEEKAPIPSAVRYIDDHGHPSFHKRAAKNYDHVFFAVWDKRDIFTKHSSVHWCPNASDSQYFFSMEQEDTPIDIGFFGSKGGLDRADTLKRVCDRNSITYDVREIGKGKTRWPATAHAMDQCKVLLNVNQKHDGPNQRVLESMLMNRPLINNRDPRDGMSKLFEFGEHYLSYCSEAELTNQIQWCLREPGMAKSMAKRAYELAMAKHQVKNRVNQILEVCFE